MQKKMNDSAKLPELRLRAEALLKKQSHSPKGSGAPRRPVAETTVLEADSQRTLHELQVHQIELEMQNTELQDARDKMELLLEKYTDLYDFAPVGYFSLDEQGRILDANLTGTTLLGVDRSALINRRLPEFVPPESRLIFQAFLEEVFARPGRLTCETSMIKQDGSTFWADLHATSAVSLHEPQKWCRVAISDSTALKRAKEAQDRMEELAVSNQKLKREITHRQAVEETLKMSEQHQRQSLEDSRRMQEQLRHLAHQMLTAQEEERKQISRDLHDQVAQTLTAITVHLAVLKSAAAANTGSIAKNIARTQKIVEKAVNIVHRFARELRPTVLDDLGLIPALHAYIKEFSKRTGIHIHLVAFTATRVESLDNTKQTVLYRVVQAALANVAKHAQASRVKLSIRKLPNAVRMEIKDDGKGFEVERVLFAKRHKRLGLISMRERVEMVGGTFSVESVPGEGTTLGAEIPTNGCSKK